MGKKCAFLVDSSYDELGPIESSANVWPEISPHTPTTQLQATELLLLPLLSERVATRASSLESISEVEERLALDPDSVSPGHKRTFSWESSASLPLPPASSKRVRPLESIQPALLSTEDPQVAKAVVKQKKTKRQLILPDGTSFLWVQIIMILGSVMECPGFESKCGQTKTFEWRRGPDGPKT